MSSPQIDVQVMKGQNMSSNRALWHEWHWLKYVRTRHKRTWVNSRWIAKALEVKNKSTKELDKNLDHLLPVSAHQT